MSTTKGLFVSSLTSLEIVASLPYSYEMRSLEKDDFDKGYLDCLRVLTYDGDLTAEEFKERYDEMDAVNTQGPGTYFLLVIEYENRILGTGTLIIERKFIHNRGICEHIEEVSIAKDQQGKKLGLSMIQAIDSVAKNAGCYKTILHRSPEKEQFYIKCGYHNSGAEMSHYYEEERDSYHRG